MGTIKAETLIIFSGFSRILCFFKWGIFIPDVSPRSILWFFIKGIKGMDHKLKLELPYPLVSKAIVDPSVCLH